MNNSLIKYVDVGAGLSISNELKKYKNKIDYIGFEPFNPEERMPNLPKFNSTTIYPYAISDISSNNNIFYLTKKSACSSLLKPNFSKIPDSLHDKFQIEKEISIKTKTIDDFDFDYIDVLKVDAQGCGYEVVRGASESLKKISVIIIELEFLELYENQKLSYETYKFLSLNGFFLYKILDIHDIDDLKFVYSDFIFVNRNLDFNKSGVDLRNFGHPQKKRLKFW